MISPTSFRNFVIMMAVVSPSSLNAFSPSSPNNPPAIDATSDGVQKLKAAIVDSSSSSSSSSIEGIDADDSRNNNNNNAVWSSLTQLIHSKIEAATADDGTPLSEEATNEIVKTAVAGSVLGTAVGSPLLIGAALGYAGSQMLQGENGDKARHVLGQAGQAALEQATSAIAFTKKELDNEQDLSDVSKKIVVAIQEKATTVVLSDLKNYPARMAEEMKDNVVTTMESEELKTLPKRSFQAVRAFLGSEEVKSVSSKAMKALKDGLESDEMKALQNRASQSLQETIDGTKKA